MFDYQKKKFLIFYAEKKGFDSHFYLRLRKVDARVLYHLTVSHGRYGEHWRDKKKEWRRIRRVRETKKKGIRKGIIDIATFEVFHKTKNANWPMCAWANSTASSFCRSIGTESGNFFHTHCESFSFLGTPVPPLSHSLSLSPSLCLSASLALTFSGKRILSH